MFDFVKLMYPLYWGKDGVQLAVSSEWITQEQADEILKGGDDGGSKLG